MKKQNLILSLFVALMLISCEEKSTDLDKVIDAQDCLDQYTVSGSGDLNACLQKVNGLNTPAAYNIRCSVGYIREGITTATLVNAFSQIETVSANSVEEFLKIISFDAAGTGSSGVVNTNYNSANDTNNNCARSLAKGATILSTYSFITNTLYKYACDNAINCLQNDTGIAGGLLAVGLGSANPTAALIGAAVIQAKSVSCSTGTANETLCGFIDRAVANAGGTSNPTAVGVQFALVLATP